MTRRLRRLRRLPEVLRGDRGSLSVAVVIWTPIVMVLCAFLVNIGFLISDRERANDLAEQAARQVADHLDQGMLKEHPDIMRIDVPGTDCSDLARLYFTDTGEGDVDPQDVSCQVANNPTVANPGTAVVTVTIQMTHKDLFSGFLRGANKVGATGTAKPIPVG